MRSGILSCTLGSVTRPSGDGRRLGRDSVSLQSIHSTVHPVRRVMRQRPALVIKQTSGVVHPDLLFETVARRLEVLIDSLGHQIRAGELC
jgi:hypothetical protein